MLVRPLGENSEIDSGILCVTLIGKPSLLRLFWKRTEILLEISLQKAIITVNVSECVSLDHQKCIIRKTKLSF